MWPHSGTPGAIAICTLQLSWLGAAGAPALADEPSSGSLSIVVPNLPSDEGRLAIALFDSREGFDGDAPEVRSDFLPIAGGRASVTWTRVPFGEYAVRLFQDQNDNGKIDTNFVGYPKEPFGFSNDAKGRFGPPGYDDVRFSFESDGMTLTIHVQ